MSEIDEIDAVQESNSIKINEDETASTVIRAEISKHSNTDQNNEEQVDGPSTSENENESRLSTDEIPKQSPVENVNDQTNDEFAEENLPENLAEKEGGIDTVNTQSTETRTGDSPIEYKENEVTSPINEAKSKLLKVVVSDDDITKTINVRIIDKCPRKPFLGGFRHKLTGVEYLNASAQTFPKKVLASTVEKFNRDTQTVTTKNYGQQTFNETSTQMTKPGCYISDVKDVVKVPGPYVTAEEKEKMRLEKIIILQSYWRRWLSTNFVKKLKRDKQDRLDWEHKQAEQRAAERAERLRREFERRMKPRTKADFDLLYSALEKWRQEEIERINTNHSGPERKAALVGLLEQETYLIQSIERHRINADRNNEEAHILRTLEKAGSAKFWRAYDGQVTQMSTQHTIRAKELKDLYGSLQMDYLTTDERLDVLLSVKQTVAEHDCKLTQELISLIDREADLLGRKVKNSNLDGLRQRINTLFIQYCKTPMFNPEIARLLKVPQDVNKLRKDIYFCPSCNKYLPATEFPLASNSKITGRCKKCCALDNNSRLRHDFTKIRFILQNLRQTEEAFNDNSKIAFIIQDADLRYLIENIWNSQSALSGVEDLYELVLIRWNRHEPWSPWNCVLFTKDEASAHMKLENVSEAYGRIFIGKVRNKHLLAKQHFAKLANIESKSQRSKSKSPVKDPLFNRLAGTVSG
eukprot:TCONS_00018189-protein